jgi:hypothetical protein
MIQYQHNKTKGNDLNEKGYCYDAGAGLSD